mmetsp:Transcript_2994/g.6909  ORF Transcript_2994/g.6909 Transcript_2994/m.6909 type:complete len:253 (+) Transcript_2994:2635-3393(+)
MYSSRFRAFSRGVGSNGFRFSLVLRAARLDEGASVTFSPSSESFAESSCAKRMLRAFELFRLSSSSVKTLRGLNSCMLLRKWPRARGAALLLEGKGAVRSAAPFFAGATDVASTMFFHPATAWALVVGALLSSLLRRLLLFGEASEIGPSIRSWPVASRSSTPFEPAADNPYEVRGNPASSAERFAGLSTNQSQPYCIITCGSARSKLRTDRAVGDTFPEVGFSSFGLDGGLCSFGTRLADSTSELSRSEEP